MNVRSFWSRIEKHPPILLRLLARLPKGRALEATEIAAGSGLSVIQVEAISQQTDWRGIDIPTARAFMVGCRCDITDRQTYRRMREYIKHQPKRPTDRFPHLRRSDKWQGYYLPLLARFAQHLKGQRN